MKVKNTTEKPLNVTSMPPGVVVQLAPGEEAELGGGFDHIAKMQGIRVLSMDPPKDPAAVKAHDGGGTVISEAEAAAKAAADKAKAEGGQGTPQGQGGDGK